MLGWKVAEDVSHNITPAKLVRLLYMGFISNRNAAQFKAQHIKTNEPSVQYTLQAWDNS